MSELRGAHVLVVGATGGLGSGVSRELADRGATLTLTGRDQAALDALQQQLNGAVRGVVAADLADPGTAAAVVDAAREHAERLDGVVFAAGVVAFGELTELDDATLDQLVLVNLVAPIRLARAAIGALPDGGFLANVSAVVAEHPMKGMAAYSATKAGLTGFDVALAGELRRHRIRVLDIRPPHTETGLATRPIAGTAPRLPTGLEPADVARRIVDAIAADEKDLGSAGF